MPTKALSYPPFPTNWDQMTLDEKNAWREANLIDTPVTNDITGAVVESRKTETVDSKVGSKQPDFTFKSTTASVRGTAPAKSLKALFNKSDDDWALFWFKYALSWDTDLVLEGRRFPAQDIQRAILYHMFFNELDTWWRPRMSKRLIESRISDFVGGVPPGWSPGYFEIGDPDCKICKGKNQLFSHDEEGGVITRSCECEKRVLKISRLRPMVQEYNQSVTSQRESTRQRVRELYEYLSQYFFQ